MGGVAGTSLPAVIAVLSLAPPTALANPHVWIEARVTFELVEHRVAGLGLTWRFDEFFSSHTIGIHDLDGDGELGPEELRALRADSFDPLARFDYHVHVWVGDDRREGHAVERFSAHVEDRRLVFEFSIPIEPPGDPGEAPVVVSLFDGENAVDFRYADSNFLLVAGDMTAGCTFRVARGRGKQSGHPRPVTLSCGG